MPICGDRTGIATRNRILFPLAHSLSFPSFPSHIICATLLFELHDRLFHLFCLQKRIRRIILSSLSRSLALVVSVVRCACQNMPSSSEVYLLCVALPHVPLVTTRLHLKHSFLQLLTYLFDSPQTDESSSAFATLYYYYVQLSLFVGGSVEEEVEEEEVEEGCPRTHIYAYTH